VPLREIRLGGGGARSALWRQIQADVYGHPVATVAADEGAAFGAALLAGVGAGLWPDVDDACDRFVHVATTTNPSAAATAVMNDRYREYRRVYAALKSIEGA
jgi:xylulokinase